MQNKSQTINSLEENVADEMANEKKNFNFEMSGQNVRKNDYEQRNNANLENVKSARKEGRKRKRPIELLNWVNATNQRTRATK